MKIALAAIALLGASPASAAEQFDLLCKGTQETINVGLLSDTTETWQREFRIDLTSKQYCSDDCQARRDIADVRDDVIAFENSEVDGQSGTHGNYVDRLTGRFAMYSFPGRGRTAIDVKAQCEVLPFKGFPKLDTKF